MTTITGILSLAIVTGRFAEMRTFYAALFDMEPAGPDGYVEFNVGDGWLLALCSFDAIEEATPGVHVAATNRCMRIELGVDDVDAEYERLRSIVIDWIFPPTDWPWGNRATWFRDPDGNLISLFGPRHA